MYLGVRCQWFQVPTPSRGYHVILGNSFIIVMSAFHPLYNESNSIHHVGLFCKLKESPCEAQRLMVSDSRCSHPALLLGFLGVFLNQACRERGMRSLQEPTYTRSDPTLSLPFLFPTDIKKCTRTSHLEKAARRPVKPAGRWMTEERDANQSNPATPSTSHGIGQLMGALVCRLSSSSVEWG